MPSLKDNFDELMERVRAGRDLGHASYEPVYYLIFPPREILDVKRRLPAWEAKLRIDGWDVYTFSIAVEIEAILTSTPLMKTWLKADANHPLAWDKTNRALGNVINKGALKDRLGQKLESLQGRQKAILLVTDLEALHPYIRIGTIESQLYGEFYVPTVFLYPGERTGKSSLKFMGFYPEDGNYRSVHIGG